MDGSQVTGNPSAMSCLGLNNTFPYCNGSVTDVPKQKWKDNTPSITQ